ncbi:MAG: hypothetical protein J5590_07385, partial [Clostridia bacterium]|nr:hypothetical protein [Clostridia bacterium]
KKLIPLPVMLLEKRKRRNKILKRIGLAVAACAVIGAICAVPWFMKLPKYNAAMQLYYDKNYPEATWAFADLGNYRNSDEMKEKCELSWRKSLAVVVSSGGTDAYSRDSYYISSNGTVEYVNSGTANKDLNTNEHGQIVSIAASKHDSLYALYEDGYVANAKENNGIEDDSGWHDIVQISRIFNSTNIALRADGRILYGNVDGTRAFKNNYYRELTDDDYREWSDDWLTETSTWTDIVSFDCYATVSSGDANVLVAAIVGVKSDGTLCAVFHEDYTYSNKPSSTQYETISNYKDMLDKFYDVNSVYVSRDEVAAITNHNTIITLRDGRITEYENKDNIIKLTEANLKSNGDVLYEDNTVIKDAVYIEDGYIVTRAGTVYQLQYRNTPLNMNVKAIVYDEWVERME